MCIHHSNTAVSLSCFNLFTEFQLPYAVISPLFRKGVEGTGRTGSTGRSEGCTSDLLGTSICLIMSCFTLDWFPDKYHTFNCNPRWTGWFWSVTQLVSSKAASINGWQVYWKWVSRTCGPPSPIACSYTTAAKYRRYVFILNK